MNERLLLVEDEPGLARSLMDRLKNEGYQIDHRGDGVAGLTAGRENDYDAIILDVMLPELQGFDVCRELRKEGINTPILMLTARGHVADKVSGLKLGADDYMTKPFEMVELLARIEALLRRGRRSGVSAGHTEKMGFGNVLVDIRRAEVTRDGNPVELSSREFRLLCYLLEHRAEVLDRDQLLRDVWGYDESPFTRTVDVHIAQLRGKLEENPSKPRYILTMHGLGYKLAD